MQIKLRTILISVFSVFFLFAGMSFAKTNRIDVIYHSKVGKSLMLKPGKYQIDVVNNTKSPAVNFYSHSGKLLGKVPVKVVNQASKNNNTEIEYNTVASNHVITEISLRGAKDNLVFSQPKTNKMKEKK